MLNELAALLKYEFRFYFRILPPLYLMLMLVALILRLQENSPGADKLFLYFVLYFICITMTIAMTVITIVHIIQRFADNFMKDQGALMFTLPITVWTLLAAKVIAAFCMVLMSTVTVFVSILILIKKSGEWVFSFMTQTINFPVPNSGEIMIIVFVASAMIVQQICLIYVAITVSHLLPRFRFAAGCGIYLAISSFLEQPVFRFADKSTKITLDSYSDSLFGLTFGNDFYISQIPSGIAALAFAALYFWATGFLLKRTFNLE
jgi:hypothetical protein